MIDSCNTIIKNIYNFDFKRLIKMNIYIKYREVKKKNGSIIEYYDFSYKNVNFTYNSNYNYLLIITNTHKLLNKREITLSDLNTYKSKLTEIVKAVLDTSNFKLELSRIDYCVDLKLDNKLMIYLSLLQYLKSKYRYMKKEKIYVTSIYLKTKYGQTNINIYSRRHKTKKEEDRGILRIEIQCKSKKIQKEFKNYGVCKEIGEYWNIYAMQEYYFKILSNYIYEGDYYKKETAYKIVNNSNYSKTVKKNLKKFLRNISKNGFDYVIKNKKYSRESIKKYTNILNSLKINPILLPDFYADENGKAVQKLEGLIPLAIKTAEEKYFK